MRPASGGVSCGSALARRQSCSRRLAPAPPFSSASWPPTARVRIISTFTVPDIAAALSRVRAAGIEPVQISLLNAAWKEAFLHPKDAYGIVIQVAEQSGPPPVLEAPAQLPAPGPSSAFTLVAHHVADIDGAVRLFEEALEGEVVRRQDTAEASVAELSWENGACLRLVQATPAAGGAGPRRGGVPGYLRFSRDGQQFSPPDRSRAADLAQRLGISLQLGSDS